MARGGRKMMEAIGVILLCALIGYWIGWVHAHHTVADECERLGGFYVGKKIFKCEKVESRK